MRESHSWGTMLRKDINHAQTILSCSCDHRVRAGRKPAAAIRPGSVRSRERCSTRARRLRVRSFTSSVKASHGPQRELVPFGIVQKDGGFSLSFRGPGKRAHLPGAYNVLIEWRDAKENGVVPVKEQGANEPDETNSHPRGAGPAQGTIFQCEQAAAQAEVKPGPNPARAVRAEGLTGAKTDGSGAA